MAEERESTLVGADAKEGQPCRECPTGKYREAKATGPRIMTSILQFAVGNVRSTIKARVLICDYCGHIEFFRVWDVVEDPNA